MKTVREEKRGKALLRLVKTKSGYSGIVLTDRKASNRIDGENAEETWEALCRLAAEGNPDYFGFDGAKVRFLEFFSEGFNDPKYQKQERAYKMAAKRRLDNRVPLDEALVSKGKGKDILTVYQSTNLLSPFELMRMKDALKGGNADAFIRAAAHFTVERSEQALDAMGNVLKPYDVAKWTAITYLPFLWNPSEHMFLKPKVTAQYASRVGHRFAENYSPEIKISVYESLLDLASKTESEISALNPSDRIDTQSFIWVVGEYRPEDKSV